MDTCKWQRVTVGCGAPKRFKKNQKEKGLCSPHRILRAQTSTHAVSAPHLAFRIFSPCCMRVRHKHLCNSECFHWARVSSPVVEVRTLFCVRQSAGREPKNEEDILRGAAFGMFCCDGCPGAFLMLSEDWHSEEMSTVSKNSHHLLVQEV